MTEGQVDWGTAVVVGAATGWMANKFVHARAHFLLCIAAGVVGATLLNAIGEWMQLALPGWMGFALLGFLGACLLLLPLRLLRGKSPEMHP